MVEFEYFTDYEFKRAIPACSLLDMDFNFMSKLDYARKVAGIPFVVNSAFRTKEYELSKGRTGTSSHCKGVAVDIRCNSTLSRYRIVFAALSANIRRIGIGKNFIHLDCDSTKPDAIWLY